MREAPPPNPTLIFKKWCISYLIQVSRVGAQKNPRELGIKSAVQIMTEKRQDAKGDIPKTLCSVSDCVSDTPSSQLPSEDLSVEARLPPVDEGLHAWMFLAASFVIEGLVWGKWFDTSAANERANIAHAGYGTSFGVFQAYYQKHEPFKNSSNLAVIGTCAPVSIGYG